MVDTFEIQLMDGGTEAYRFIVRVEGTPKEAAMMVLDELEDDIDYIDAIMVRRFTGNIGVLCCDSIERFPVEHIHVN